MSESLQQLIVNYKNIEELMDNPDIPAEMLTDALNSIEGNIENKVDGICHIIRKYNKEAEFLKEESDRLGAKRKTIENKVASLKRYMEDCLRALDKKSIKTALNSVNIQNNPPSINIVDEKTIPDTYKTLETVTKINKKQLIADIKSGAVIEGAELNVTSSLRIR